MSEKDGNSSSNNKMDLPEKNEGEQAEAVSHSPDFFSELLTSYSLSGSSSIENLFSWDNPSMHLPSPPSFLS